MSVILNPLYTFVVIPEMPKALSGIFADVAGRPRISASAFRGDNTGRTASSLRPAVFLKNSARQDAPGIQRLSFELAPVEPAVDILQRPHKLRPLRLGDLLHDFGPDCVGVVDPNARIEAGRHDDILWETEIGT